MVKFRHHCIYGFAAAALSATPAFAASIDIAHADNISQSVDPMTGNVVIIGKVCVRTDTTGSDYLLTPDLNEGGGSFEVSDGTNHIVYTVRFRSPGGQWVSLARSSQATIPKGTTPSDMQNTCSSSGKSEFEITILENALNAVKAGQYQDTLNFNVALPP